MVELTGEIFYREDLCSVELDILACIIHLRLGEYRVDRVVEEGFFYTLYVITVDNSNALDIRELEQLLNLFCESASLVIKAFLLFYIYSIYHCLISFFAGERSCADVMAEICVVKVDHIHELVCSAYCRFKIFSSFHCAKHSSTRCNELAVF